VRNHTRLALIAVLVLASAPAPATAKHPEAGQYKHRQDYHYTLKSIFIDIRVHLVGGSANGDGWTIDLHATASANPVPLGTGQNFALWRNYNSGKLSTPAIPWQYSFDGTYKRPPQRLEDEYFSPAEQPRGPFRCGPRDWTEEHRITGSLSPHWFEFSDRGGRLKRKVLFPSLGEFPNLVSDTWAHFRAEGAFPELSCSDEEGNGFNLKRTGFSMNADYGGPLLGGPEKVAHFDFARDEWHVCVEGACSNWNASPRYAEARSHGSVYLRLDKVVVQR
jgi:hypothetical protein